MGDNHNNVSSQRVKVGQKGFEAIMEAFALGLFMFTYEFRFYNFEPEHTPLLAFTDSLIGNMTLQTIGFARNGLNEDMCAAILQRLYFNQSLTCLDFNGNPLTITVFKEDYIKKYFKARPEFTIIYD
mmetsp:Transcript_4728/g.8077  ORF Transcript_4728/g.8077 Transcript_4728/m.8077 type:complete len:127 (-) Transcript_4728:29-409(-)